MAQQVQSVERALSLLEVISQAQTPPTVTELAAKTGVNRATAWRPLNTLEYFELIYKDSQNGALSHWARNPAYCRGSRQPRDRQKSAAAVGKGRETNWR